jgi:putative restriction endonuclease
MAGKAWTREETIVAFNLYCKIPFGQIHARNPRIIELAELLDRTPASIGMKLGNLGSFDPELQRRGVVGLQNASKLDEEIWNEFHNNWDHLAFESETLLANLQHHPIESIVTSDPLPLELEDIPIGRERETIINARVNQQFFRQTILSSYNYRCCITGLTEPSLLVASHIIPWSIDTENRLNPRNGLCLNSLHDRAFDTGLITITSNYEIKVSQRLDNSIKNTSIKSFFYDFEGKKIMLPERFTPTLEFLKYHEENIFKT